MEFLGIKVNSYFYDIDCIFMERTVQVRISSITPWLIAEPISITASATTLANHPSYWSASQLVTGMGVSPHNFNTITVALSKYRGYCPPAPTPARLPTPLRTYTTKKPCSYIENQFLPWIDVNHYSSTHSEQYSAVNRTLCIYEDWPRETKPGGGWPYIFDEQVKDESAPAPH